MRWFLITGFYSGLLPKAPGTWGSLVATILAYLIIIFMPNPYITIWLLILFFSVVGFKFINEYEKETNIHDDKRIVIDEFIGVLISIGVLGSLKDDTLIKLFLAFISFRFFDIYKPSIIGRVDKNLKGALGVIGDDVLAGIFGGILAAILYSGYLEVLHYLK